MTWQLWIVAAVLALGVLSSVSMIGQERKPITPNLAVAQVVLSSILITLIVWGSA